MTGRAPLSLLTALACVAGFAAPAQAVTRNASVTASVIKPLTLSAVQNLDLGTITLNTGTWSSATVGISRAGVLSCQSANVICSGLTQVARYRVTGTNKQVVVITVPNVTMTNQSDPTQTLTLTVDSPRTVTLTSSGQPGNTFDIGGSLTLSSTTASGTYTGTFNVTVDYQ